MAEGVFHLQADFRPLPGHGRNQGELESGDVSPVAGFAVQRIEAYMISLPRAQLQRLYLAVDHPHSNGTVILFLMIPGYDQKWCPRLILSPGSVRSDDLHLFRSPFSYCFFSLPPLHPWLP